MAAFQTTARDFRLLGEVRTVSRERAAAGRGAARKDDQVTRGRARRSSWLRAVPRAVISCFLPILVVVTGGVSGQAASSRTSTLRLRFLCFSPSGVVPFTAGAVAPRHFRLAIRTRRGRGRLLRAPSGIHLGTPSSRPAAVHIGGLSSGGCSAAVAACRTCSTKPKPGR